MAEPKRKARENRAVGADPLAGLDSERLAGLLVGRGGGARAGTSADTEEAPRRKRTGRRSAAMPLSEELQLELETAAVEKPADPAPVKKPRPATARSRRAARPVPEAVAPHSVTIGSEPAAMAPELAAVAQVPQREPASHVREPELVANDEETFELPPVDAADPESAIRTARALMERGRSTQAVALLERALEGPARSSSVAVELGRAHVRAGAFNEAERALQRAMRLDPEDGEAHLEMGILFSKKGLYANAIQALREGIVMECDAARGHYYLGICLNQLDRIDDAEDAFEQAVAADPGFDRAWYQLGIVWDRKGDVDRAREMYRRARQVAAKARG